MTKPWTAERRQQASELAKSQWDALDPAIREERRQRSMLAFRAKYPERTRLAEQTRAAIAAGELMPQPCDRCGEESNPLYDWEAQRVTGWRCYQCRKALETEESR